MIEFDGPRGIKIIFLKSRREDEAGREGEINREIFILVEGGSGYTFVPHVIQFFVFQIPYVRLPNSLLIDRP